MTKLQEDLLNIYNSLTIFSKDTITSAFPSPIKVYYELDSRMLVFEQKNHSVRQILPSYYCFDLKRLPNKDNPTYLLPEDYDYLMSNLSNAINSGELLKDRTMVSPTKYGFDIYSVANSTLLQDGPTVLASMKFVSSDSFWFKFKTKRKYKL